MTEAAPWQSRLRTFVGLPPDRAQWPVSLQGLPPELEASSLTVPFSLPLLARALQLRQNSGQRVLIGLNGPVGAGKSTLARQLQILAPRFGLTLAVASIDDVYRPLGERRQHLAGNPFGVSRVPPGSHDVPLLLEALDEWRSLGILTLPRFDKTLAGGEGERNGVSVQEADVVLLEGWLTGCRALATADLARALQGGGTRTGAKGGQEREGWLQLTEAERAWLPRWNGALRAYSEIWDRLDGLWVLKPTQWTWPRRWRFQAEARQRRAGGGWLPAADLEALVRSSLASLPPALYQDPLLDPIQGPSAGMTNERLAGTTHDPTIAPIGAEVVALIDSRRRCRWSGLTQDCPIRPATTFQLSSESASSATG
jgi:D-glycerate 3-kinase